MAVDWRNGGDKQQAALRMATRYQFIYSLAGLILGVICVIGGIVLFFHGVLGSTSWFGSLLGAQTRLADAAPGTVLFVVGLFVVWATKFDVSFRGSGDHRRQRRRSDGNDPT